MWKRWNGFWKEIRSGGRKEGRKEQLFGDECSPLYSAWLVGTGQWHFGFIWWSRFWGPKHFWIDCAERVTHAGLNSTVFSKENRCSCPCSKDRLSYTRTFRKLWSLFQIGTTKGNPEILCYIKRRISHGLQMEMMTIWFNEMSESEIVYWWSKDLCRDISCSGRHAGRLHRNQLTSGAKQCGHGIKPLTSERVQLK